VVEHARRANNLRAEIRGAILYATTAVYGPTPVEEAIRRSEELVERASHDQHAVATINLLLAQLYAMRQDFDRARDLYRTSQAKLVELRAGIFASSTSLDAARVELMAGDYATAEALLRADFDALTAMRERYSLASVAGLLARVLELQGRTDEADEITRAAEEVSAPDDLDAQSIWRGVRARVLASRGRLEEADLLIREAAEIRERADTPVLRAEALMDLAAVMDRAGRPIDSDAALAEALDLAQRKGDAATTAQIVGYRAANAKAPGS
jgi:tetratricopeptide (TPR) repeat protein